MPSRVAEPTLEPVFDSTFTPISLTPISFTPILGQSLIPSGHTVRPWTVFAALACEALALGVFTLIPLFFVEVLPPLRISSYLAVPLSPPPPLPPAAPAIRAMRAPKATRIFQPNVLVAPVVIPRTVPVIIDAPSGPVVNDMIAGVPGGIPGGIPGGVMTGIPNLIAPPPPPPPPIVKPAVVAPPPDAPERIQVGSQVQAAMVLRQVPPHFPAAARSARIGGTVVLKAVIATDGTVTDLSVVSGHPLLVSAAIDAVKQWLYKPTFLNGKPVEVSTDIVVHFTLIS